MKPLSPVVRRTYLGFSIAAFLIVLPIVIFYADGWRYQRGMGFVKTGGIFLSVPYANADVYLNGEHVGTSGFLDRSFYIDNLVPSAYMLRVSRDGDRAWDRQLIVEQQLVTDARAVLLPNAFEFARLSTTTVPNITNARIIEDEAYLKMEDAFTATSTASTTIPVDEFDGIGLFLVKGDVFVRWLRPEGLSPSIFCGRPSFCVDEIPIERGAPEVTKAQFYNGGVVYRTRDGGIYFAEIDVRPNPLLVLVYNAAGADMRVVGDMLVVKDGSAFLEVTGL